MVRTSVPSGIIAFAALLLTLFTSTTPAKSFSLRRHRYVFDEIEKNFHKTKLLNKLGYGAAAKDDDPVVQFNFTQKLDHFRGEDLREWQQIAYINKQFYKPGGPIFLMLGGEGPSTEKFLRTGAMATMYAPKLNAMMLQIEHRFYGRSWPTPDMSVESLQYLSSQQALADAAYFIANMTEKLKLDPSTTRWVTFGGSYSGALSAWMRLKYPHLVFAAIASSAPVEAELDFSGYLEVVVDALNSNDNASSSWTCVETLKEATAKVVELMQSDAGRQELDKLFDLCTPLQNLSSTNEKDLWTFYSAIIDGFEGVVQYNHDYSLDVADVCDKFLDNTTLGEPIERMRDFLVAFMNTSDCVDFSYNNSLAEELETSWKFWMVPGGRQWLWQTCTEFGYFQTTTTEKTIFETELPLDFYLDMCQDVFGGDSTTNDEINEYTLDKMQQRIDWTNAAYGGNKSRNDWSRIVFVNGGADPWHVLSVLEPKNTNQDAMKTVIVPGQSHCADMYSPRPDDTTEMTQARKLILNSLDTWLQEADEEQKLDEQIELAAKILLGATVFV